MCDHNKNKSGVPDNVPFQGLYSYKFTLEKVDVEEDF